MSQFSHAHAWMALAKNKRPTRTRTEEPTQITGRAHAGLPYVFALIGSLVSVLLLFGPRATAVGPGSGSNQPPGPAQVEPRVYLPWVSAPTNGAPTEGRPDWSAPIAVSPVDGSIWVVNPDAGSVTVLDATTLTVLAEVPTGTEPWSVSVGPDGAQVYVVNRGDGTLSILNTTTYSVETTLWMGPAPTGIALSPSGATAYVTVMAGDELVVLDLATRTLRDRIPTGAKPYAVAVSNDGDGQDEDERVYVTHVLARPRSGSGEATDDSREAVVTVIDAGSHAVDGEIVLDPDVNGSPNLLAGISLTGNRAWLPHVRAAPALPAGLTTTIFAAVSALDLRNGREDRRAYLPLNDQIIFGSPVNNPVAAIPAPDGQRLYVVLAGSDLVEVVDVSLPGQPRLVKFLATGANPLGMALSGDGKRGYVMNYLSRSVTVLDLERLEPVAEVAVTEETLEADVLRGKILFNNASNPRLSQGSWISCASCHVGGMPDGITWIFPDGPRQTPALWNAGETLPWHWSAALDEAQDVEETIHLIQHGLGLAPGTDPSQLGAPNEGRSADLDALATFLMRGMRPATAPTGKGDLIAGRDLFMAQGCADCHGGPHWTRSALPGPAGTLDADGNGMVDAALRDVGTDTPADRRGQTGFDVPSLLAIELTAPYLHDGSMPTLEALLASGHPAPGQPNPLNTEEIAALGAFLRSIGPATAPVDGEITN